MVIEQLDCLLKPLGFSRQKATWNRRTNFVIDVVDVQVSKSGDVITINAGVLDMDVYAKLWDGEPPEFVEQPTCTVCARIGELFDGRDRWWKLSGDRVVVDVVDAVGTRVLPFLERMHTRKAMEQWLTDTEVTRKKYPQPIIYLAILKYLLGEVAQGCELLAELQRKSIGAWRSRAAEVAARLRCT